MRLGGPVPGEEARTPEAWVAALRRRGYRAAYCPIGPDAEDEAVEAYAAAARAADIVIAEVGAWSNPLSPDPATRSDAVQRCIRSLALADRIGARCCVNIAGSRGEKWDGPHPDDLTDETFAMIVTTVQTIIDAARPARARYTLEPMPWMYPDSAESYRALVRAIDRPAFGVHFDPVNIVSSPQRYFANGALIEEFLAMHGPQILAVHAKDIVMGQGLTVHLDEVRPGLGTLDYQALLRGIERIDPEMPLMLEHLPSEDEYVAAAAYVRAEAERAGVTL